MGVGTSSPNFKVEVVNDNFNAIRATGNSANSVGIFVQNTVTGGRQYALVSSGGGPAPVGSFLLWDDTAGSSRLAIAPSGNIGIGTPSPAARLDVAGAISAFPVASGTSQPGASARLGNMQTNGVLDIGVVSAGGAWLQYTNKIDLSQNYPLLLNPKGGSVGIGTTSPTHKLAVNGTIRAKEVIVDTGWSDYAFKPDYKLASLSEVEGAIQSEGHLPGIPSAQEVAEHGVSMGEMQSKLLANIEELTLHQIAQEKRISAQQVEISALRSSHHPASKKSENEASP